MSKKKNEIKVELIHEDDHDAVKKDSKISNAGKDSETKTENSDKPKKKWKKADYLANNEMPPPNRLIPAAILILLLVGVYTGFNALLFPSDADFSEDTTTKTGWQVHIDKLTKENQKQQEELNELNRKIKIHGTIIAEQGKKIKDQEGKITKNKQDLDDVTQALKDHKYKSDEERNKLNEKYFNLDQEQKKLKSEMQKMKEVDEQLKNSVNDLRNRTNSLEERFDKLSGDMLRGEKERKEMKQDIQGLKERFDYLQEYLKKHGIEVPEFEEPDKNNLQ